MIARNLGQLERLLRLLSGILFALWTFTQADMNIAEWFVFGIALMLMLNGVFARCFLWWLLGIKSTDKKAVDCY